MSDPHTSAAYRISQHVIDELITCPHCTNRDQTMITPVSRLAGSGQTTYHCDVCGKEFSA